MDNWFSDPNWVVAIIFPCASIGGIAELLRSGRPINIRTAASAFINSGLLGLVTGAIMIPKVTPADYMTVFGISVLCGLGGNAAMVFVFELMRAHLPAIIRAILGAMSKGVNDDERPGE